MALTELEISQDAVFEFFEGARKNNQSRTIVLVGHLVVEYLLNRVILAKCKAPQKILKDSKNYPFSVKLQLLYSMGLLPDHIYGNISRLNTYRNQLAHQLVFDESKIDRSYFNRDGELKTMMLRKSVPSQRRFLRMLAYLTVDQLGRHMSGSLGLSRLYRKAIVIDSTRGGRSREVTVKE